MARKIGLRFGIGGFGAVRLAQYTQGAHQLDPIFHRTAFGQQAALKLADHALDHRLAVFGGHLACGLNVGHRRAFCLGQGKFDAGLISDVLNVGANSHLPGRIGRPFGQQGLPQRKGPIRPTNLREHQSRQIAGHRVFRVLFQNLISALPLPVAMHTSLSGVITIGPLHLGVNQTLSILVTLTMLVGLNLFLHRTVAGRAMRAASEDVAVLRLMGLRANTVVATAFAISGLLAGVAGALWVAQRGSVDPLRGALPVLKAFIAAIIGGLGSLSGAVAGGFLLGCIEVLLQAYLPENLLPYRDAFAILLVIAVLLFRPQGLLARKTLVKL